MRKSMLLMAVLLILLTGCSQKEESVPTFIMIECNQEFLKDGVVTGTDCDTYTYNEDGLAIYGERHQDGSLFSTTSMSLRMSITGFLRMKKCLIGVSTQRPTTGRVN